MSSAPVSGVPYIDLKRFEPEFLAEFLPKVESLVRNTQFVGGPEVARCEQALARATGSPHAIACANGTDAIQIALRAAGIGPKHKVIIPDMTFWATFEAVVNVGAIPYTVDVDAETLHWNLELFERALREFRPQAAILVHLYGWAAPETEQIRRAAADAGVVLIEDCAQAFGTLLKDRSLIAGARIATTSFYPAKVLGASGDAGALFTADPELARMARKLGDHGRKDHYSYDAIGWNSRLGVYEAAFLSTALPFLDARIASRRRVCARYREKLAGLPLEFKAPAADVFENGYLSVGLIDPDRRPRLAADLKAAGIGFAHVYPGAMHEQEGARNWLGGALALGHAAQIARSVLNLPCFAYMRDDEVDRVVEVVRHSLRG